MMSDNDPAGDEPKYISFSKALDHAKERGLLLLALCIPAFWLLVERLDVVANRGKAKDGSDWRVKGFTKGEPASRDSTSDSTPPRRELGATAGGQLFRQFFEAAAKKPAHGLARSVAKPLVASVGEKTRQCVQTAARNMGAATTAKPVFGAALKGHQTKLVSNGIEAAVVELAFKGALLAFGAVYRWATSDPAPTIDELVQMTNAVLIYVLSRFPGCQRAALAEDLAREGLPAAVQADYAALKKNSDVSSEITPNVADVIASCLMRLEQQRG
jgi:hypothetical protein